MIKIFDEEYEKRRIITADFTAEKLTDKGYCKESDVAAKIFAEIDHMCVDIFGHFNPVAFAELKNKYKENEQ